MKALVIEDELLAREHMVKLLQDNFPDVEVVGAVGSIKDAVSWIAEQPAPDVIFMDVELSAGTSLDIFTKVDVPCPVVMTTAYDQYAVQAFE
ncbi:MAG: response regulator, partial [Bacteroidales bacterium]|nr:response regulator [Bacteroidales bacterium]